MLPRYLGPLLFWVGAMLTLPYVGLAVLAWLTSPLSSWPTTAAVTVLFIAIAWFGVLLSKAGKRMSQESATERYTSDQRPPVLLLRPFNFDGALGEESWFKQRAFSSVVFGRQSFEERINSVMQNIGPTIALGRHGEMLSTYGFAREYVDDSNWKRVFKDYVSRSAWIVILLYRSTANLEYELDLIVKMKGELNILLVPPPSRYRTGDWQSTYYRFSKELGFAKVEENAAALLVDHGQPRSITMNDGSVEAQILSIHNALIPDYLH